MASQSKIVSARAALLRGTLVPALAFLLLAGPAAMARQSADPPADPPPPAPMPVEATPDDGPTYPIGSIEVRYLRENPLHPPLEELEQLTFELSPTPSGYVIPRAGGEIVTLTLATIRERPVENYHASAVQRILETIQDLLDATG